MQKRIGLGLALSLFTACTTDEAPVVTTTAVDQEIARLTEQLADVPGELVVTHASELPFSPELEERVATAGKVIHVDSSEHVAAYVGIAQENPPEGVTARRHFSELGGDIVIAEQDLLPTYLAQRDPAKSDIANASGLAVGDGKQWPESTVAFQINPNIVGSDLTAVLAAINAWNAAIEGNGTQQKVRYVPRYWGDGRPYVEFVKATLPPMVCGRSMVGRYDNVFTNWYSHSIEIAQGCFNNRTINHEMAHTVGLNHEQQRCDRDNFVGASNENCDRRCGGDSSDYGPYNYLSLMHGAYGAAGGCAMSQRVPASSNFRGMPNQAGLATQLDINDIQGMNQSYVNRPALPAIGASRFYTLTPVHAPNKVVQVPITGSQMIIADRAGITREEFAFVNDGPGTVRIQSRMNPNLCITNAGSGTSNGTPVGTSQCAGFDSQRWVVAPNAANPFTLELINKVSGKALDVSGWGTSNGTLLQQWDHTGATNQRFVFNPVF